MDNAQNQFKRSVLYYPTIRIPSGQWLKQAVLYWDEVGSIVPRDYGGNWLIRNSPDLEYLVGEDLFHPFDPRQLAEQWHFVSELVNELRAIVESESFQNLLPGVSDRLFDSEIHLDKVRYLVLDYLLEKGLARDESPDGKRKEEWVFFERTTALLYMSLLAKYLTLSDNRGNVIATPGTDRPEYQNLLFFQKQTRDDEVGIETSINNWLPIPDPNVPIQDIVAFKRRRQDELLPLQLLLVDFEKQLKKVTSVDEVKQIAYKFDLDKRKGLNDLSASLKDAKIETGWGALNTLVGVSTPPLIGYLAGKAAELAQVSDPIIIGGIGFAVSATIAMRLYWVGRKNAKNKELRNSPYSYLFHAQKELIIPG